MTLDTVIPIYKEIYTMDTHAELYKLRLEIEELKQALAFYALLGNWQGVKNGHMRSQIERDFGNIARSVLGDVTIYVPGALREEIIEDIHAEEE